MPENVTAATIPASGTVSATVENNSTVSSGDLQNIQASYRLNGKNYLKWAQLVRTFLKGKGKIRHLLGTGPSKEDPTFDAWDEHDAMVMSWLWNSMLTEISDSIMFLSTAKEIWDAVKETYSKVHDAARIYEIKTKLSAAKHGARPVTEYSNFLQGLWQEMDHYQCIQMSCKDDAVILKRFIEKERIYDFLAGLNAEFDSVRVQILGKEDLPSLNETMAIIRTEEGRRSVMLETQINEGSALVAKRTSSKESEVSQSESTIKPTGSYKPPFNRDNLYCTYCKKYRHTRERCWRLNGRPPNRNNSDGKQAHLASNPQADETNPHSTSAGSCSLAFTGISCSFVTNVSDKLSPIWVVDSGATDHMTSSFHLFISYSPSPSYKKITIADGSVITVAGQGDIPLGKSLILKDVLHVQSYMQISFLSRNSPKIPNAK